jgi:arylsulfatase A-like enzyme
MRLNLHPLVLSLVILETIVGVGALGGDCEAAAGDRPNIIFLLTDDQRWDTLGCMGNQIIQTPNVDRLAAQGVVFDNCFVTTSICMTNRACIFTGQYAARHGVWSFSTNFTPAQLAQTYPALLKRAGYYIGFIGKWGVGTPPQDLFDYNRGWPGQNRYFDPVKGKDVFAYLDAQSGQSGRTTQDLGQVHLTARMGDQAIEFLDLVPADRPFCLSLSFKAPHCQDGQPAFRQFPYDPRLGDLYQDVTIPPAPLSSPAFFAALPEFLKTSENRNRWKVRFATPQMYQHSVKSYYRLISGVDRVVGRIVAELKQKGLHDNTIIVYTGDNGFYLGERGFAGKWFPHEVSIRVPLVVYGPRLPANRRGQRCEPMVLSIDLAPTMLAMAGVEIPQKMQGRSLLPWIEGERPPWRSEFFYEHLFRHASIPRSEAVRNARYKYIRFLDIEPPYEELYDLSADPDEAHNLAGKPEYTEALKRMREKWQAWRERVK